MKFVRFVSKITPLLLALLLQLSVFSQAPQRFNYQAVLRGSNGQVLTNKPVKIKLSFLSGSETGLSLYAEEHPVTTNGFGLINVEAGGGTFVSGSFPSINWSAGNIWLKIDIDENLTGTYTSLGSAKLLSVPYALFASSGNIGPQGPQGEEGNGILNVEDNGDGTLTFNFTKSLSYTTTNLKGQEGDQGDQGIPGPKGDQGNEGPKGLTGDKGDPGTGLSNRGNWVTGTTYNPAEYVFALNTAQTANSMWIVKASTAFVSNNEPRLDLTNWVEFQAPQGPLGPQGIQGVQGPQGIQGPVGPLVAGASGQTLRNNGATWIANDNIFNTGTNVGIGTTLPTQKLDINGSLRVRGNIFDADNLIGDNGQILYKAASGIKWQNPTFVNIGISGIAGQVAMWSTANSIQGLANVTWSSSSLQVASSGTALPDDPIFEVKNKDGKVVFGVYQGGVRVYVEDTQTKGAKGGFAVGGLSQTKAGNQPFYFKITPDTARIYINDSNTPKGAKGGFAVGGMSQTKAGGYSEYLRITPDSARININEPPTKGAKGGFAVGGLSQTKGTVNNFMQLTPKNYFIGHDAGKANTDGLYNSFIGYQSGLSNKIGSLNTFMGFEAGFSNTGSDNTFIGYKAGRAHQSKGGNVYIGSKAGELALNGEQNVFIGEASGTKVTSAAKNVFVGFATGNSTSTGSNNVFIGNESGKMNLTGESNVFLGDSSGFGNTNSYNVFLGKGSGKANTGQSNAFIGYQAGLKNIGGANNVFIGTETGRNNTTGNYNTFLGYQSGYSSNSSYNTFLGYKTGYNNIGGERNIFLGYYAGFTNTSGYSNLFIGDSSGYYNVGGKYNIFLGNQSGRSNTEGYSNIGIGLMAGFRNTIGNRNVFLGNAAGMENTEGIMNVFIGNYAGSANTLGKRNVFIGRTAGWLNTTGEDNVIIGSMAGFSNTTASNNVFMGTSAGLKNETGSENIFIGKESGYTNLSGLSNTFLGYQSGYNYKTGNYNTFIGYQAGFASSTAFGTGNNNVGLGYLAGSSITSGADNVFIGSNSGKNNTQGSTNIFIGNNSGFNNKTGNYNTYMGIEAGYGIGSINGSGIKNVAIGYHAGYSMNQGNNNVCIGVEAGAGITNGYDNAFLGTLAGIFTTTGFQNVAIGNNAGFGLGANYLNTLVGDHAGYSLKTGSRNLFLGSFAGYLSNGADSNVFVGQDCGYLNVTGKYNTYLGFMAGRNALGSRNVFLGFQAGMGDVGSSNKLYIANSATAFPLIWGDFALKYATINGNLGINTQAPTHSLHVEGQMRVNNGGDYDVWIQGGASTSGELRNLALLGLSETFGDKLIINFGAEYQNGVDIGGNVNINSNNTSGWLNFSELGVIRSYVGFGDNNHIFSGALTNSFSIRAEDALHLGGSGNTLTMTMTGGKVGIGTTAPDYKLDVAGIANLNKGNTGAALLVNGTEALWYNGTYFSWGYGGSSNLFDDPVGIKVVTLDPNYYFQIANNATLKAKAYAWDTYSDSRIKTNQTEMIYGINAIMKIKPKQYIHQNSEFKNGKLILSGGEKTIGLIAQELFEIIPEAVNKPVDESKELWSISYEKLTPVLIKSIQEQQQQINALKEENAVLKTHSKEIEALKAELEAIKAMLKK